MLTYILALAVGVGSLGIYIAAFFFPEIHRKNDFIWSGIGLFYALTLWVFAPGLTGWLFLGHVASVALLGWFGWQTLSLRRQLTPQIQQTPVPSSTTTTNSVGQQAASIPQRVSGFITGLTSKFSRAKTAPATTTQQPPATIGKTLVDVVDHTTPEPVTQVTETTETQEKTASEPEATPPSPPSTELVANATEDIDASPTELTHEEVEKTAPESQLAPPAEAPPEKIPPNDVEN